MNRKVTLKDILTFKNILDTRKKYTFIWSVIFQFPIISAMAGTPIDFNYSIFDINEIQAQLVETFSYVLGIIGTISVGIFSIKRSNDDKHKANIELIEKSKIDLCELIDDKFCYVLSKLKEEIQNQNTLTDSKVNNVQTQIGHLKEVDKETGRKIYRIESKIFNMRNDLYDDSDNVEHPR